MIYDLLDAATAVLLFGGVLLDAWLISRHRDDQAGDGR